jgi:ketosteroid isomerase-like protein
MDRSTVQTWLDRYVEAWKTYDRATIADLFGADATYRYHPYDDSDDVIRGRDEIVRDWIEPEGDSSGRDEPGSYDAHYEPYAVDGDRAVAVGWSKYWKDETRSTLEQVYDNVFLLRFDGDGRCIDFTELFMKRPDQIKSEARPMQEEIAR